MKMGVHMLGGRDIILARGTSLYQSKPRDIVLTVSSRQSSPHDSDRKSSLCSF